MNINITPEDAKILLASLNNSSELKAKLQKIVDDAKPKDKDFDHCFVKGYNINKEEIELPLRQGIRETTFRTLQEVDAIRALAQLTQWYGNIDDKDTIDKYLSEGIVTRYKIGVRSYTLSEALTDLVILQGSNYYNFLSFNNQQAAQDFLTNHWTLLNQAIYFL